MPYEYCVIGNGLLGAAIALELAHKSPDVCVLGAAYGQQDRYYSSHEDDSRIARLWHRDPYWQDLARRNATMLEALAESTPLPIFQRTPVVYSFCSGDEPETMCGLRRVSRPSPYADRFQYEEDTWGGIIEPKTYIAALNEQARLRRATIIQCVVQNIKWDAGNAIVSTTAGEICSKRIVNARGVYFDHEGMPADVEVVGKILVYLESEHHQRGSPYCLIDSSGCTDLFEDVYGIVQYKASGNHWVSKFGFSERHPVTLGSTAEIAAWFQADYHSHPYVAYAKELWKTLFSDEVVHAYARPCAFVVTSDRRPILSVDDHHCSIAGCNGMAAKCCQALAEKLIQLWNV